MQYLRADADNEAVCDSLQFILSAMSAMKQKNPLTESFLVQLDIDIDSLVARNPKFRKFKFGFSDVCRPNFFGSLLPFLTRSLGYSRCM